MKENIVDRILLYDGWDKMNMLNSCDEISRGAATEGTGR